MTESNLTYKQAGVDIDAGNELIERIRPVVAKTVRPEVLTGLGGFGGLFSLDTAKYPDPVLVSGTDGVGTKLKLAQDTGRHDTIGIDLVAMCVNDVIVQGAEPLFFLDYFACGRLDVDQAEVVIRGIAAGCELAGCALIGGETAEMPDMYAHGEYDLAGFSVGAVNKTELIDGSNIRPGDIVLGLPSSGPHSNGYSLIRRVLESAAGDLDADLAAGCTLGDALLRPTRIYVKALLKLLSVIPVRGLAHITGGGILENLPRILPEGVIAHIDRDRWPMPPVFGWLQSNGNILDEEMLRTFNCGIGMVVVVAPEHAGEALTILGAAGENPHRIGRIEPGDRGVRVA